METISMPTKIHLKWILAPLCAAIMTNASSQELANEKITLDPKVVSQIIPHIASQPVTPMPPLAQRLSVAAKGNFGRTIEINSNLQIEHLDNGLYEVHENSPGVGGSESQGRGTAVSLCGLITVVSGGNSHNVIKLSGLTQGTATSTLHEWRFSSDAASSNHLVNLESTAPSLCNLAPGTNFTYHIDGIGLLHMKRQLLSDKSIEISASSDNVCVASELRVPAKNLLPQLTGDYVEVSCKTIAGKRKEYWSTYAYLLDHHYYLTLTTKTSSTHTEITYAAVEPATQ